MKDLQQDGVLRAPASEPMVVLVPDDIVVDLAGADVIEPSEHVPLHVDAWRYDRGAVTPRAGAYIRVETLNGLIEEWAHFLTGVANGSRSVMLAPDVPLADLVNLKNGTCARVVADVRLEDPVSAVPEWLLDEEMEDVQEVREIARQDWSDQMARYEKHVVVVVNVPIVTTAIAEAEARHVVAEWLGAADDVVVVSDCAIPDGYGAASDAWYAMQRVLYETEDRDVFVRQLRAVREYWRDVLAPMTQAMSWSRYMVGEIDPWGRDIVFTRHVDAIVAGTQPLFSDRAYWGFDRSEDTPEEEAQSWSAPYRALDALEAEFRPTNELERTKRALETMLPYGRVFGTLPIGYALAQVERALASR